MDKTMTPSAEQKTVTEGQINKAVANYRALLEKSAKEFGSGPFQLVLGQPELADEQYEVLRRHVGMVTNLITRRVKVNRNRTPQEVLDATGRKQHTDGGVVARMPKGEGDETEVVFFKLSHWVSNEDLDEKFALRGLKPADPYSLAAVNEADPAFTDEHPNATHWQDRKGKWCCVTFDRLVNREVFVGYNDSGLAGGWWFAGLRKRTLETK